MGDGLDETRGRRQSQRINCAGIPWIRSVSVVSTRENSPVHSAETIQTVIRPVRLPQMELQAAVAQFAWFEMDFLEKREEVA